MNQNFVRCKICGQKFKQIINAHLKKHKISLVKKEKQKKSLNYI